MPGLCSISYQRAPRLQQNRDVADACKGKNKILHKKRDMALVLRIEIGITFFSLQPVYA